MAAHLSASSLARHYAATASSRRKRATSAGRFAPNAATTRPGIVVTGDEGVGAALEVDGGSRIRASDEVKA